MTAHTVHRHEYVLCSLHGPEGLDYVVLDSPTPLTVMIRNGLGRSITLQPGAKTKSNPRIRLDFGDFGARVELDESDVSCPGFVAGQWDGAVLPLTLERGFVAWPAGMTLAVELGGVTVTGEPGWGTVAVELGGWDDDADGVNAVPLVRLASSGDAANAGAAASWADDGELAVDPRRPGAPVLRLACPAPKNRLLISPCPGSWPGLPAIASPGQIEEIVATALGGDPWAVTKQPSQSLPLWEVTNSEPPPRPFVDVRLADASSDLPPGHGCITVYDLAPDGPGRPTVVNLRLLAGDLVIKSFCADVKQVTNINAPAPVHLSWEVTNATWVTLSGVGVVDAKQEALEVFVEETTNFVLTAFNASLSQVASKAARVKVVPDTVTRMVPLGTICLWSGNVADIPPHWALCDGTRGLPDLRDRFVVGASETVTPGTAGEADTHTHPIDPISVSVQTSDDGAHTHGMPTAWYARNLSSGSKYSIDTRDHYSGNVQTQSAGTHHHTVQTTLKPGATGQNDATVRPKWYALCYIGKVDS